MMAFAKSLWSYIKSLPARFRNCFQPDETLLNSLIKQQDTIDALTNALVDANIYTQKSEHDSTNRLALVLMKLGGTAVISEEIQSVVFSTPHISIDVVPVGTSLEMKLTLSDTCDGSDECDLEEHS